jgi:hypothetical protein
MATNTGKKIPHRDRKNGAAREAWEKQKKIRNGARGKQVLVKGYTTPSGIIVVGGWAKVAA